MAIPNIKPYFLKIGPIELRWYGLAYILGVTLGIFALKTWCKKQLAMSTDDLINFASYMMIGILLGGRLGYILFYDLSYYLHSPSELLAIWHGGMSFHGGVIGSVMAVWIFAKKYAKNPWLLADGIAAVAPIGVCLGRLANFINHELYGRITTQPWGVIFPNGGSLPRHPSQLYEATFEGLVLGAILYPLLRSNRLKPGQVFSLGLVLYSLARFGIEFVREPDPQVGLLWLHLSLGQYLCVIMMGIGSLLFIKNHKTTPITDPI